MNVCLYVAVQFVFLKASIKDSIAGLGLIPLAFRWKMHVLSTRQHQKLESAFGSPRRVKWVQVVKIWCLMYLLYACGRSCGKCTHWSCSLSTSLAVCKVFATRRAGFLWCGACSHRTPGAGGQDFPGICGSYMQTSGVFYEQLWKSLTLLMTNC